MVSPTRPTTSPLLSVAQAEQFQRDGYCVVEGLFNPNEIAAIEAFFEEFKTNGLSVYDGDHRFDEVDKTKTQLRAMHPHRYSETALGWALKENVTEVLGALLERPPLLVQTMYYFKPPGAKGQGIHQDNFYLLAAPATCIAAWTAIDAATIDNGCLYVVPGSHRHDIHCPKEGAEAWMSYGDSHIKPFPRDTKPVPVEVPKGATMFFWGQPDPRIRPESHDRPQPAHLYRSLHRRRVRSDRQVLPPSAQHAARSRHPLGHPRGRRSLRRRLGGRDALKLAGIAGFAFWPDGVKRRGFVPAAH